MLNMEEIFTISLYKFVQFSPEASRGDKNAAGESLRQHPLASKTGAKEETDTSAAQTETRQKISVELRSRPFCVIQQLATLGNHHE